MNYDVIAKIIVALSIGGLFADLLTIFVKTMGLFAKVFSKEYYNVNYKAEIWTAGILTIFISAYFIFL